MRLSQSRAESHEKSHGGLTFNIYLLFRVLFHPIPISPLCQQRAGEPQATPTPAILPGRVAVTAQPNRQAVGHRWSRRRLLPSSAKLPAKPAGHQSSRDLPALVIAPSNCRGRSGRMDTVFGPRWHPCWLGCPNVFGPGSTFSPGRPLLVKIEPLLTKISSAGWHMPTLTSKCEKKGNHSTPCHVVGNRDNKTEHQPFTKEITTQCGPILIIRVQTPAGIL
jgi:hypothetical protein